MATPTVIRVTRTYYKPDGSLASGRARFTPTGYLQHEASDAAVVPLPTDAPIVDGVLDVELLSTDDPDWSPSDWQYDVALNVEGVQSRGALAVPYDSAGGEMEMPVLAPAPAGEGDAYAGINHVHGDLLSAAAAAATYLPKTAPTVTDSTFTVTRSGGGAARWRTTGDALDIEVVGDVIESRRANQDFTGAQVDIRRIRGDGQTLVGKTEFGTTPYGAQQVIDAGAGYAALGSRNGLTNLRFCGYKDTAGAPTTGTWDEGDLIMDSTHTWYRCTADGTPGTWA